MEKRLYLAYGSNLNIEQMKLRCPDAEIVGTAEIKEYRLLYKGSMTGSYLTIEKHPGGRVPVGVWAVSEDDELMLDSYEGCPTFYYKTEMELDVRLKNGEVAKRNCFIYIMHEERELGIPSRRYVETCKTGYAEFGFDQEYLDRALRDSENGFRFGMSWPKL